MQWYSHDEALQFADLHKAEIAKNLLETAGFHVVSTWVDAWCPEDDGVALEIHVVLKNSNWDSLNKQYMEDAKNLLRSAPVMYNYWPYISVDEAVE